MSEDPALIDRQSAYVDSMRAVGRRPRTIGFAACLIGVLVLVLGRLRFSGEAWLLWLGGSIVAFGWGCFVVAVARRLRWVRTHPFDPKG